MVGCTKNILIYVHTAVIRISIKYIIVKQFFCNDESRFSRKKSVLPWYIVYRNMYYSSIFFVKPTKSCLICISRKLNWNSIAQAKICQMSSSICRYFWFIYSINSAMFSNKLTINDLKVKVDVKKVSRKNVLKLDIYTFPNDWENSKLPQKLTIYIIYSLWFS